jgi:hypothetical protein
MVPARWPLLEAVQIGEKLAVDEVVEVVAGQGSVVVELAVFVLGRGPDVPAIGLVEDVGVFFALERGLVGLVLLEPVEIFQEQEPGCLLGVVELGGAAGLFPEDVVDVLECLFKHGRCPAWFVSPTACLYLHRMETQPQAKVDGA